MGGWEVLIGFFSGKYESSLKGKGRYRKFESLRKEDKGNMKLSESEKQNLQMRSRRVARMC